MKKTSVKTNNNILNKSGKSGFKDRTWEETCRFNTQAEYTNIYDQHKYGENESTFFFLYYWVMYLANNEL